MDTIRNIPAVLADCNVVITAVNGSPCPHPFHRGPGQRNVSCTDAYCVEGTLGNGYGPIDDLAAFLAFVTPKGVPANPAIAALQSLFTEALDGNVRLCSSEYMVKTVAKKLTEFVDTVGGHPVRRYGNTAIRETLATLKAVRLASGGVGVASVDSESRVAQVRSLLPASVVNPTPGKREADVDYEDQRVLAAALKVREDLDEDTAVLLVTADMKLLHAVVDHLGHRNLAGVSTGYYAKRARLAA